MRHQRRRGLQALAGRVHVMALAVPLLLAACGSGDDAPPQVYNLDAAITQAFAQPLLISNLTGQDPLGNSYSLSIQFTPGADAVFEGALRKTSQQTITISGGGLTESETVTAYYVTGPFGQVGAIDSMGGYSVSVRTGDWPMAASVGASGALSNDTAYTDSSKTLIGGTAVTNWSLEAATENTAFACNKTVLQTLQPPLTAMQTVCLRIDGSGKVMGGRVTVGVDGLTMEFS